MKISDTLINELLNQIGVTKEEAQKNIRCPFGTHNDNNPSFKIYFNDQNYHCFACHERGSLAHLYEVMLQKEISIDVEGIPKNKYSLEVSKETILPRINFLQVEEIRQNYLELIRKRKIHKSTYDILENYVDTDIMSPFYGYYCFAHDIDQEFICGRIIIKDVEDRRPKYLYLKGVGRPLLGLSFIDTTIKTCILVEGIFDWFTLMQLGVKNVLCTFGTSVSKAELYKLVDIFTSCLVIFDKDFAGFDGTLKTINILKEFGIRANGVYLPPIFGKDLNEALERGLDKEIMQLIDDKLNGIDVPADDDSIDFNQVDWLDRNFRKDAPKLKTLITGLPNFDELIGGFTPGLVTLLGKTSQGKSALAIFLAVQLIINNDCKVLYVTYEISMNQVWCRVLSIEGNHFWPILEKDKGALTEEDRDYIKTIGQVLHVRTSLNFEQIMDAAKDYDVIFIDYIQVAPSSKATIENEAKRLESDFAFMATYGQRTKKTFFVLSSIAQADYGKSKNVSVKNSGGGDFSPYLTLVINREDLDNGDVYLKCYVQKNTKGQANQAIFFLADFAHNRFEEVKEKQFAD